MKKAVDFRAGARLLICKIFESRYVLRAEMPSAAVRWIKFTIRENHGNSGWTYLDEVLAYGKQEKVSDEDGRYTGKFATNFGPIEMTQTGNQISGCYAGGH